MSIVILAYILMAAILFLPIFRRTLKLWYVSIGDGPASLTVSTVRFVGIYALIFTIIWPLWLIVVVTDEWLIRPFIKRQVSK